MKSIRLSLILFILLLQGIALGAVLALLYRTTSQTLAEKNGNTRHFLRSENETRCDALRDKVKAEILYRATELSTLVQSRWGQSEAEKYSWWTAQSPGSYLGGPFHTITWIGLAPDGPITPHFTSRPFVQLQAAEGVIQREKEAHKSDYFQIYSENGDIVQRSDSLGSKEFSLSEEMRDRIHLFKHDYDDAVLRNGVRVRRVTLKMPVTSVKRSTTRLMFDSRDAVRVPLTGKPSPSASSGDRSWPVPAFYIQYGRDLELLEGSLQSYQKHFEFDLANLQSDSDQTLASLRWWVVGAGLALFAATAAGACWLITVGLSPLKRLSDAVSRVSTKDFRLAYDPTPMPRELRPIYDRLEQTLAQLERAFAREKQAAADISHELRTPLTALLTTLDVGLRRPRTPEQYAEMLRDCRMISRQLSQLVERILALARIDAGADSVRAQEVDIAELTAQCVALVRPLAEARELSLQLRADGPAPLTTDPNKLREIITNLLHNAVEYNKPNGRIDVAVERHNGHMQVHVSDTGIGISPKSLGHIFERFYRIDESRQADSLHAGLGLSIVKSYLDILGGSISVQTAEGEGSTFSVQLPVSR